LSAIWADQAILQSAQVKPDSLPDVGQGPKSLLPSDIVASNPKKIPPQGRDFLLI
jgi:hypothetical protein